MAAHIPSMPARTHHSAPKFDGDAQLLPNFFREIEQLAEPCNITQKQKIEWAIRYAPLKVTDLWENQPAAAGNDWAAFKAEIYDLYPGSQDERKYSIVDLEAVMDKQMKTPMTTSSQFGEYYRDFTQIAFYLKKKGRLNDMLFSDKFIGGMDSAFRQRLRAQLHAEDPTHHPDDPYEIGNIKKAALLILSANPSRLDKVETVPLTHVKKERFDVSDLTKQLGGDQGTYNITMLAQEIAKFINPAGMAPRPNNGYTGTSQGYGGVPDRPRSFECIFCSDPAHFLRQCPKVQEYIQNGKCKRSPEGQIVLPNGERTNPRVNFGRNIMERIDHWHSLNTGGNTMSSNLFTFPDQENTSRIEEVLEPVRSQFVWTEVDSDDEETSGNEDNELVLLEAMVINAQKKIDEARKRQKGTGPVTRGAAAKINTDQPAKVSAPAKGSAAGTVAKGPTMAEAAVAESTNPPVFPTRGSGAPSGQFRYITPIESATIVSKVTHSALDASIPLTVREIMAISPDVRKNIKEQITTKKVLTGDSTNTSKVNHIGEIQSYMAALPARSDGIVVSNHSEKLRAIDVVVNGHRTMEAIMDEGSQIIAIRKDLWQELGLGVRSDYQVRMEAANQSVNSTIGLLQDLKFTIAGYDFYLQVQVVENASYEILLGLPFHVLTQLKTEFYGDGSSRITLTDPNSGALIMVPTKERKPIHNKAEVREDINANCPDF